MSSQPKKVSFWGFLFKVGDDYMTFLRNLTPAVLFYAIFEFTLDRLYFSPPAWKVDDVLLLLCCLSSLFIWVSVLVLNMASFGKKLIKALRDIHQRDDLEPEGFWATLKVLWQEANVKQLLFFSAVTSTATFMVLLYGTKYAVNFYSSMATMAGS